MLLVTKGYGLSLHDIDWSCPSEMDVYIKAYQMEREEKDALVYAWIGSYGISALTFAIEHCLAGRKAKAKYIDKPIMKDIQAESKTLSEEETQKAVDLFFAQEKARRVNWRRKDKRNKD